MKFSATHLLIRTLTLLVIVCSSSNLRAENIIIGGYDYPPFMDAQSNQGMYHKLMSNISRRAQLTFQWEYYPYARLNSLFEHGSIAMEVGAAPEWTANKGIPGVYTETFYELEDIAIFRPGEAFKIEKPQDIKGKTIGVVRGYGFEQFKKMFNSKQATRFDANNEKQLINMLFNKRLDAIFINKDVFLFHKLNTPKYTALQQGDIVGAYKVGIRVHPSFKDIIPRLNKAIADLKKEDKLDSILK